jgi:hypothetical protein
LELNAITKLHNLIIFKGENKFSKNIKISIFEAIFFSQAGRKRSRAEPKILQLELWLEPARLGLITSRNIRIQKKKLPGPATPPPPSSVGVGLVGDNSSHKISSGRIKGVHSGIGNCPSIHLSKSPPVK